MKFISFISYFFGYHIMIQYNNKSNHSVRTEIPITRNKYNNSILNIHTNISTYV